MANPAKKKGTGGETELKRLFESFGLVALRNPAGARTDLNVQPGHDRRVQALATRPDHGTWLVTVRLHDFFRLIAHAEMGADVEVKRYARFAHHTLFEEELG